MWCGTTELLEAIHLLLLDSFGRVRIVPHVIPAGLNNIFLPVCVCSVDAVIRRQYSCTMVDSDSTKTSCFCSPNHTTNVFGKQNVDGSFSEQRLDFGKLRSVELFTFALRGDYDDLHIAGIKFGNFFLGMIDLIFQAKFFLVRTAANAATTRAISSLPFRGFTSLSLCLPISSSSFFWAVWPVRKNSIYNHVEFRTIGRR